MEFSYEKTGYKKYLLCTLNDKDTVDQTTMGMLANNRINGTLPFTCFQMDEHRVFRYDVSDQTALAEYFKKTLSRKKILRMLKEIVSSFSVAEQYMIERSSYVLNANYMYINPKTEKISFVVLPVYQEEKDISAFLKDLLFHINYDQSEDCSYIASLTKYFGTEVFQEDKFLSYLKDVEMMQPHIYLNVERDISPKSGWNLSGMEIPEKAANRLQVPDQNVAIPSQPEKAMEPESHEFAEEKPKKKGLFGRKEKKEKKVKEDKEKRGLFGRKKEQKKEAENETRTKSGAFSRIHIPGEDDNNFKANELISQETNGSIPVQHVQISNTDVQQINIPTEISIMPHEPEVKKIAAPVLKRLRNGEIFYVTHASARIGRSREQTDICIEGNTNISRIHVILERRQGRWILMDNDSLNGTFVNGIKIEKKDGPVELVQGSRVRLANEDFEVSFN